MVAGHRKSLVEGMGRRTKTAHARTRGAAAMVYGDFEFGLIEVTAKPVRRWSWRGLVE
jgi:hypothetical protein